MSVHDGQEADYDGLYNRLFVRLDAPVEVIRSHAHLLKELLNMISSSSVIVEQEHREELHKLVSLLFLLSAAKKFRCLQIFFRSIILLRSQLVLEVDIV